MKKKIPRISAAEWDVLTVLWDASEPLGLAEIIERLPESSSRNPKTINTFLSRLTAKNVVSVRKVGRSNLYSAAVAREDCVRQESKAFIKRVFGQVTAPALLSLIEDADLSPEEIEELQRVLDQKKEDPS